MDLFNAPEIKLPVLRPRILDMRDFSHARISEVDLLPEWLKAKRRAPERLKEWLKAHMRHRNKQQRCHNSHQDQSESDDENSESDECSSCQKPVNEIDLVIDSKDQDPELGALERLLKEHGSLLQVEAAMKDQESALKAAQVRETRFSRDPLLKRRRLVDMSPQQLHVLVIALQNELAACNSYMKGCNMLKHPVLESAIGPHVSEEEKRVIFAEPEPSHLIDVARLHLFTRDARPESDLESSENDIDCEQFPSGTFDTKPSSQTTQGQENVAVQKQQHQSLRRQMDWLREALSEFTEDLAAMGNALAGTLQGGGLDFEKITSQDSPQSEQQCPQKVHPSSWPSVESERSTRIFLAQQQTLLEHINISVRQISRSVENDIGRLHKELVARDEIIEMQQDIELKLIKSKRETASTNIQLASLVMRTIYNVYPRLWEKLSGHSRSLTLDDLMDWEEKNNEWLKHWVAMVSHEDSVKDGMTDVEFPRIRLASSYSNVNTSNGKKRATFYGSAQQKPESVSPVGRITNQASFRVKTPVLSRVGSFSPSQQHQQHQQDEALVQSWIQKGIEKEQRSSMKTQEVFHKRMLGAIRNPPEKAVESLLNGLLKSVLDYSPILVSAPSPAELLDRLQEFSYDVCLIPNLVTQHKVGCAFGLAWAQVRMQENMREIQPLVPKASVVNKSQKESREEEQEESLNDLPQVQTRFSTDRRSKNGLLVKYWLEECSRLAFGKTHNTTIAWVKGLAQHIQSRIHSMEHRQVSTTIPPPEGKYESRNVRLGSLTTSGLSSPRRPQTARPVRTKSTREARGR